MFCEPGARGLPAYLTIVFTVVFGVLLVLNSLGCFFGQRWKKRRDPTGNHKELSTVDVQAFPPSISVIVRSRFLLKKGKKSILKQ